MLELFIDFELKIRGSRVQDGEEASERHSNMAQNPLKNYKN